MKYDTYIVEPYTLQTKKQALSRVFADADMTDPIHTLDLSDREYCINYIADRIDNKFDGEYVALQKFNGAVPLEGESGSTYFHRQRVRESMIAATGIDINVFCSHMYNLLHAIERDFGANTSQTDRMLWQLANSYYYMGLRANDPLSVKVGTLKLHRIVSVCQTQAFIGGGKLHVVCAPLRYDMLGISPFVAQDPMELAEQLTSYKVYPRYAQQ